MSAKNQSRNDALVRYLLLPTLFLSVALLGGLRISEPERAFLFVAPPLITLILAVMLMALFLRGRLIVLDQWLSSDQPPLTNVAHALTLMTLFFASAQAFNSVLPESGLLFWLFAFFFLWTMWNNLFSPFDPRQLLRSLAAMFGLAFVLKHILVAALSAPAGSWLQKLTGTILEGLSLGTLNLQPFAPSTGYISFFCLALFVAGLCLLPRPHELTVRLVEPDQTPQLTVATRTITAEPVLELEPIDADEITQASKRPAAREIIDVEPN